jgi:protein TonB
VIVPDDDWAAGIATKDTPKVIMPRVLKTTQPKYTSAAMRLKLQGDVAVQIVVGADGLVDKARVVRSLDPVNGLDDEALKAVKEWRFSPGTLDGVAVPVAAVVFLNFRLH